jgi:hypothetical protein
MALTGIVVAGIDRMSPKISSFGPERNQLASFDRDLLIEVL